MALKTLDNLLPAGYEHAQWMLRDDLKQCKRKDILAFMQVPNNLSFIMEHGLSKSDIDTFLEIQREFNKVLDNKQPKAYDNVEVHANNGHMLHKYAKRGYIFHKYAKLEKCNYNNTGFHYCENASMHYIDMEHASISGGAFHEVDINNLEYIGTTTTTVWTWGHNGACGNGGIYIPVKVNNYKLQTDRKFIPLYCYTYKDSNNKRIYIVENFHAHSQIHKAVKYTKRGLINYLKQRNLKLGDKIRDNAREVVGEFTEQQHMSLKEYKDNMPVNCKEFDITDNGSITHAYMNGNVLHYCNCNVKDRYQVNSILRD